MVGVAVQYLNEVNKNIVCPGSLKKTFLKQLETEAQYFCADHIDVNMEMLSAQFGTPEEVAEEFMTELGSHAMEHCKRRRQTLYKILLGILIFSLAIAVFVAYDAYAMQQRLYDEAYVDAITYTVAPPSYD